MLFATRRSYNAQHQHFTNNMAQLTRYVWVKDEPEADGSVKSGTIKKEDWFERAEAKAQSDDVLIYVHGFNTTQPTNVERLGQIETGLKQQGFTGSVVAFEWPSNGHVLAYDADANAAKKSAPFLVSDLIIPFLTGSWKPRIHILAHSMGGYASLCGFRGIGDSHTPGTNAWKVDQVAFASADVHEGTMEKGAWGALCLRHHSNRVTNYYSMRDRVLKGSGIVNGTKDRIGRVGLPGLVFKEHEDVDCSARYDQDVPDAQDTATYSHRWWFESEAFYRDLILTLAGKDGIAEGTRIKKPDGDFEMTC